ncbi:MAG: response regulator [Chitinophagaceae bacterium]
MDVRKKILLADDDLDDRELFSQILEERADAVLLESVENGIEVLDFLNRSAGTNALPDLIIIDHNMPRMNGRQTLQEIKSDARFAGIPVVIYSTYSDDQFVNGCLGEGALHVATKPFHYREYKKIVDSFIALLDKNN